MSIKEVSNTSVLKIIILILNKINNKNQVKNKQINFINKQNKIRLKIIKNSLNKI